MRDGPMGVGERAAPFMASPGYGVTLRAPIFVSRGDAGVLDLYQAAVAILRAFH
jgi:hypothetical protein